MFTVYEKNNPGGMMDPLLWQGFEWIRSNTQKDADIYFFYGDRYQQSSILFATERNSWKVNADDFVASAQNQSVKRVYSSYTNWLPLTVRKGLFRFEEREPPEYTRDICNSDYYVFDKLSQYPQLVQHNMFIKQILLDKEWIEPVFSNQLLDILKNNQPGVNCLEE
jgi:hypothetical protein